MKDRLLTFWKTKGVRLIGIVLLVLILAAVWLVRTGGDGFSFTAEGSDAGTRSPGTVSEIVADPPGDEYEPLEPAGTIVCEIDGAVVSPGVYELPEDARVNDLVEAAGGLAENASTLPLNRAERLADGVKIVVPKKGEESGTVVRLPNTGSSVPSTGSGRININTADKAALESLAGIGPVTAQKILDYRRKAGAFRRVEDIMNVSGIGEKTFEKIRDRIFV